MSNVTTGVRITVDASDIQNKFTKSVDQLNASLSKNQRALGLVYNEQGILTNALGQTVEGLSQSAIKLGQYVDELGRVRTFQGGFIEGLTRTQIELGQYADELGNVYDRFGDLIGQTEKARKAQEDEARAARAAANAQAESAKKIRDSLSHATEGFSKVAGQFAIFQQLLENSGESSSEFGKGVASAANAISVATGSFKASMEFLNGMSEALRFVPTLFAQTATTASAAAPAVATLGTEAAATGSAFSALGGPVTLAISAVAALSAGILSLKASSSEIEPLSASFEDLEKKARRAGDSINSLADALEVGAFADARADIDAASEQFTNARENLEKAVEAYNKAVENSREAARYSGQYVAAPSRSFFNLDQYENEYKNAIAEYNEIAAKYIDAARESQKTEEDKINEQKAAYSALLKVANQIGDSDAAETFRRQIETLDEKILEARQKQAEEAEEAAKKERDATIAASGVAEYLNRTRSASQNAASSVDAYASALDELVKLAVAGTISADELESAQTELANDYRAALSRRLGVELVDAQEKTINAFEELSAALEQGAINQEQYDAARTALEKKALDAVVSSNLEYSEKVKELTTLFETGKASQEQYDEATRKLREDARNALGVEDRSANATYNRRIRELDEALRKGIVEQKERDRLVNEAKENLARSFNVSNEALEAYENRRKKAEDAYADGLIDAAERDKRLDRAARKLEKARDAAAAQLESEKKVQSTRASLGVDSLMESLKSPVQKYRETLESVGAALRENAITANEADALRERAIEAYLKTLESDDQRIEDVANGGTEERPELARSMTAGSEELYLAQVRNATSSFQSNIQNSTSRIEETTGAALETANLSAYYLYELVEAAGKGAPVWG